MDIDKIIKRVTNILMTPKTEWSVIADEPATVSDIYKNYIVVLAAIPAIVGFIQNSLIGHSLFGVTFRTPIGSGLAGMLISYALTLVSVYVMAVIIDALAPTFGAQKNRMQAFKAAAYSWTAGWVAGICLIIPWVGVLFVLAGTLYSIYLLYLGLQATMKCPPEKTAGYTALSVVCAIVLSLVMVGVAATITAPPGVRMVMEGTPSHMSSDVTFDKNAAWRKQP